MLRGGWLQQPFQPGTNIVICRHKNTKVQTLPKIALRQHQNTVHNDARLGLDSARLSAPQVGAEVLSCSMTVTCSDPSCWSSLVTTVVFPEPVPPAMPTINGFTSASDTLLLVPFTLETTLDSVKSALSLFEIRPVPEIIQNQFALVELNLLGIWRRLCFERRLFEKVIPGPDSKDLAGL